jgi:hypothetical protein
VFVPARPRPPAAKGGGGGHGGNGGSGSSTDVAVTGGGAAVLGNCLKLMAFWAKVYAGHASERSFLECSTCILFTEWQRAVARLTAALNRRMALAGELPPAC